MTDWITPKQVADALGERRETVYRRLEDGRMHGHKPGKKWQIHPKMPELWVVGGDQREPCGCSRVTPLRKARSA